MIQKIVSCEFRGYRDIDILVDIRIEFNKADQTHRPGHGFAVLSVNPVFGFQVELLVLSTVHGS